MVNQFGVIVQLTNPFGSQMGIGWLGLTQVLEIHRVICIILWGPVHPMLTVMIGIILIMDGSTPWVKLKLNAQVS